MRVSYSYGFASEVGGGFYDRSATLASAVAPIPVVPGTAPIDQAFAKVAPTSRQAVIQIPDSLVYAPGPLQVPANASFTLQAADKQRPLLLPGQPWAITLAAGASLTLNGLLLGNGLTVTAAGPATLSLVHCTVVPGNTLAGAGPLTVTADPLHHRRRPARSDTAATTLSAQDSVLDGNGATAVTAGTASFDGCTVLGAATLGQVATATDTLFCGALALDDTTKGSVSSSFVPSGTATPSALAATHCQPALALSSPAVVAGSDADRAAVLLRVVPSFTSTAYGDPGYVQLRRTCAPEILTGGSDNSEMGVFHHLYQPQRLANVQAGLGAYLRLGLLPTVFFVT